MPDSGVHPALSQPQWLYMPDWKYDFIYGVCQGMECDVGLCSFGIVSNSTWNQRISREKPTNVAKCDELVGLFRRNYDENREEKRKLPTKFMIYARIVGFLADKRCLI